ncbi:MAG: hypothetical protein S4CHLAM37_15280 [Chlamydiia bacterium]|nr:hypothetical protein [Chlamydiia bacterium]
MGFTIGGDYVPNKRNEKEKGPVKVYKEKRKGSYVTLIKNLPLETAEKKELLSSLKKSLACGGSLKGEEILLQGDKLQEAKEYLKKQGYKF